MKSTSIEEYYNYRVYGLNIRSQIEVDEFLRLEELTNQSVDVKFLYGSMPEHISNLREEGKISYYKKSEVWFSVKDVADYYIHYGNTVIVEPCINADKNLINIYLMCSCLGFIMIQREQLAIHGGVVNFAGKGVIFTGDRGAGKSTITTALRGKGYKFLSDDVAAIYFDEIPYIYSGFPFQKVCNDMMDTLGCERDESKKIAGEGKVKYIVPAFKEFYHNSLPLTAIVKLSVGDVDKVVIEELKGHDKLDVIMKNIYRMEFLRYIDGIMPIYIKKCLEIVKKIDCYKITRPKEGLTVNEQIKLIEEIFYSPKDN